MRLSDAVRVEYWQGNCSMDDFTTLSWHDHYYGKMYEDQVVLIIYLFIYSVPWVVLNAFHKVFDLKWLIIWLQVFLL